jgi:hypothetical protein
MQRNYLWHGDDALSMNGGGASMKCIALAAHAHNVSPLRRSVVSQFKFGRFAPAERRPYI